MDYEQMVNDYLDYLIWINSEYMTNKELTDYLLSRKWLLFLLRW